MKVLQTIKLILYIVRRMASLLLSLFEARKCSKEGRTTTHDEIKFSHEEVTHNGNKESD